MNFRRKLLIVLTLTTCTIFHTQGRMQCELLNEFLNEIIHDATRKVV